MISFEKGQKFTGQVAYDLLHKAIDAQEMQEVQETIDAMTPAYFAGLEESIKKIDSSIKENFLLSVFAKKNLSSSMSCVNGL